MTNRLLLAAAFTTVGTMAVAESHEGNFDPAQIDPFECVTEVADGDYRARFSTNFPLYESDGSLSDAGHTVSRHSELMGNDTYQTEKGSLESLIEGEIGFVETYDVPEEYEGIVREQARQFQKGIDAITQSEEIGEAKPACPEFLGA